MLLGLLLGLGVGCAVCGSRRGCGCRGGFRYECGCRFRRW